MLESPGMVTGTVNSLPIYLASNSPRRRELLALGGWEYETLPVQVDETPLPAEEGTAYVQRLARDKAMAASKQISSIGVVIAADTSVINNRMDAERVILGKPHNRGEALEMLRDLRGHSHLVHTAIAIINAQDGSLRPDLCTTIVTMREYSDAEIDDYVASGDSMDKAGAYAIQHNGFHPVQQLDGCFANVMGLPLCHVTRSLLFFGITPQVNIPRACQDKIGYDCPVYSQILIGNLKVST